MDVPGKDGNRNCFQLEVLHLSGPKDNCQTVATFEGGLYKYQVTRSVLRVEHVKLLMI